MNYPEHEPHPRSFFLDAANVQCTFERACVEATKEIKVNPLFPPHKLAPRSKSPPGFSRSAPRRVLATHNGLDSYFGTCRHWSF